MIIPASFRLSADAASVMMDSGRYFLPSRVVPGSLHKHAIPIREKSVLLRDRMFIRPQDILPSGKGRNQHQQRGFGQMKVSEQSADYTKQIGRASCRERV